MKFQYLLYSAAFLALSTGCNDAFLDREPQSLYEQTYWKAVSDLETYANSFYTTLPGGVSSLDDTNSDTQVPNSIHAYIWGETVVPTEGGSWSKENWSNLRNLNYFMTHYQQVQGDPAEINKYVAEIRFFRAKEYFAKIQQFGDVPWLEEDLNAESELLYGPKMKRNLVFQKIVEDLDFAIEHLPAKGNEAPNRLNKDIARHLKARFCLNEGTHYKYHTELGYTAEANKWLKMAADETDKLIESGKYEIYSTGKPKSDYYEMFRMENKSELKEAILYIDYAQNLRQHNMGSQNRESQCGFSKDFVESFLCTDGKPIHYDGKPNPQYKGDKTMKDECANRDPRFKQLIVTEDYPIVVSSDHKDSTYVADEASFVTQFCFSGYRPVKGDIPVKDESLYMMSFFDGIAYRYAETLLINAEAKAELGTITDADLDKTVNKLRVRVGMPKLKKEVGFKDDNWPQWGYQLSPVLQEIRRERRIELAGEGFRYDDLVRWKAGNLLNNVRTYLGKWNPKESHYEIVYPNYTTYSAPSTYTGTRKWNDKLYLLPIPTGELQRNPQLLPQNPGWE
ncbi:lipoprotein [gut metagenome]|uniref:Lipoprotein n=1 Tax=gut metagenome TaxID=749906 RepID=J9GK20_9ZZZZ